VSRPAVRVGCWRRRVTGVQEEWPSRMRACSHAIQNPAYRLADAYLRASGAIPPGARQVFGAFQFIFCDIGKRACGSFMMRPPNAKAIASTKPVTTATVIVHLIIRHAPKGDSSPAFAAPVWHAA